MGDETRQRSHTEGWEMRPDKGAIQRGEMGSDKGAIQRDGRWVQTKEP